MNFWLWIALLAFLYLLWLVVTKPPSVPKPAVTLDAELVGPSPKRGLS